jgi:hypothetical protein
MIKFIATALAICLIITRFYLIYKVLYWLFRNYENPNISLESIQWFLCAILLDLYVSSMEKSYNVDIYKEKIDEK